MRSLHRSQKPATISHGSGVFLKTQSERSSVLVAEEIARLRSNGRPLICANLSPYDPHEIRRATLDKTARTAL